MFPVGVVVLLELLGLLASIGQIEEPILVKELVPDLAVEALDHPDLHRASGLDGKVVDVLVVGPSNEPGRSELSPVVGSNGLGLSQLSSVA